MPRIRAASSGLVFVSMLLLSVVPGYGQLACPVADLTGDCYVDLADFAVMARQWLTGVPMDNEMRHIHGGDFSMGDHHNTVADAPVHAVYVSAFFMSRFEVTNRQYCEYLNDALAEQLIEVRGGGVVCSLGDGAVPYGSLYASDSESLIEYAGGVFSVRSKDGTDMANQPVVKVSWYGAVAYCNWRSEREGYESCYNLTSWTCDFGRRGYRLATEAEWEFAARFPETRSYYVYPWGDDYDGSMMNCSASGDPFETGSYPWTTPVGYYNGGQTPQGSDMGGWVGLYDLAGNVREWCNDRYSDGYYLHSPRNNPRGPVSGLQRVLRGGSWEQPPEECTVAVRDRLSPDSRLRDVGFRVCLGGFPPLYSEELSLRQRAQLHHIGVAIDMFVADSGYWAYPPSNDNLLTIPAPHIGPDCCAYGGAQKLAEAVAGWDLLGYHRNSDFRSDGMSVGVRGELYMVYQATAQNIDERQGPFIEMENANAFRLGDIYEDPWPLNPDNFVLCDMFEKTRHSGKRTGMPILYFRARTQYFDQDYSNAPASPLVYGIDDDVYYYRDNMNLLALGQPDSGEPHVLCGDDTQADWQRFEEMILNENITVIQRPYRAESYILISAGLDGIYGTADDITNFQRDYP